LTANGVASTSVDLGQTLGVKVTVEDLGTVPITQVGAGLFYNNTPPPTGLIAWSQSTGSPLTIPGQQANLTLSWKATENITGLNGWFDRNLSLVVHYNGNVSGPSSGSLSRNVTVSFAPSQIAFTSFTLPPTTFDLLTNYDSIGTLAYNGSHGASIELCATLVGNARGCTAAGAVVLAATVTPVPGAFSMPWSSLANLNPGLVAGKSYVLTAMATYNQRVITYNLSGTYSVPPPSSSPASFLFQTFLGLPLWVWLAIAAAAVVGIVLFLFVARRQAAGKLVECGECGNLIPEDATTCPKCGAEFESDLIRCSRCASTIPANSKFCPECAAQLLGTPGEAESDPEKQAYADFTEKYRAEAKRELGDNYSEGAFWDWWKRQPTYTPFSQWSLQQGQGTPRAGMTAPPIGTETTPEPDAGRLPPKGGGGGGGAAAAAAPSAPSIAPAAAPVTGTVPPAAASGAGLKPCPSCGKEIPSEYLVCPFCNAVTQ
jgi:RNA polymerase subunit RPABC4/transcription elongation factor Spt4